MVEKITSTSHENIQPKYVDEVPVLTSRERHRILYPWDDTHAELPDLCVHELFERQVARDPDAVAIVCEGRQLSYRELNERANQVARYLRHRGVGPEDLVGVCLRRSPELVVALLGVWKAGGAYVPMDPLYPQERLNFMLSDAAAKILLTEENCKSLFAASEDLAICLDSDGPRIAQESIGNLSPTPSSLAYVLYTSGSTGNPKGVMIPRNALINFLHSMAKTPGLTSRDVLLAVTTISFDISILELVLPLIVGAKLILATREQATDNSELQRLLEAHSVTVMQATPTAWRMLVESGWEGQRDLRIFCGGEALPSDLVRQLLPRCQQLWNMYGPTETTIWSSTQRVTSAEQISLGAPIANTQFYVVDEKLQLVLPGSTGELLIGGVGLARGYLKRPELTAEKFIPDIFSGAPDARLYRTGDEVRCRLDGTLEFLGRLDHQVKLRGFRIELGEIESAMARIEGIRQAVVAMREDRPGEKRLVAYYTATDAVNANAIPQILKTTLPSYMVPSVFLRVEQFPLTPNGKLDRKALPSPQRARPHLAQSYVAPRTALEKKLAAIWMELLNLDNIGIDDNFYDLGGDSLLAVLAMLKVRETFGLFPNMQTFFPTATIAELVKVLTQSEAHEDRLAYAVPVQPEGNEPPLFWIGAGLRSQQLSAHLGSNQPFIGIGIEPKMIEQLQMPYRVEELAGHLVVAIRAKQPHGPYRLGGFCQEALVAYEIARQLTTRGETVELLALLEPEYPRQSVRARIATKWRRKMIRANFHIEYLKQLGASAFPQNARNQLEYLRDVVTQSLSRSFQSRSPRKNRLGPQDFGKINSLSVASYNPTPLDCPTAIFRCKDWPFMSAGDPYFGWRELLTGGSETYEIPGDHEGIFHEPNVKILAEQLKACLRNTRRAPKPSYEVTFDGAQTSN